MYILLRLLALKQILIIGYNNVRYFAKKRKKGIRKKIDEWSVV